MQIGASAGGEAAAAAEDEAATVMATMVAAMLKIGKAADAGGTAEWLRRIGGKKQRRRSADERLSRCVW